MVNQLTGIRLLTEPFFLDRPLKDVSIWTFLAFSACPSGNCTSARYERSGLRPFGGDETMRAAVIAAIAGLSATASISMADISVNIVTLTIRNAETGELLGQHTFARDAGPIDPNASYTWELPRFRVRLGSTAACPVPTTTGAGAAANCTSITIPS